VVDSLVTLVRAPNPSPMTLDGTNSYLIDGGNGEAICIDPGPAIESHVEALLQQCARMRCKLTSICLTHGHPDHAPAAAILRERTGAPIFAHAESRVAHDRSLSEGDLVRAGDAALRTIVAPGHSSDHLVFYEARERALFTGDVVIGQGFVLVAPPDGDMRAYLQTLQRLLDECSDARTIYGGHGEPVRDPAAKLREYIEHRRIRERELIAALEQGERSVPELVRSIYVQTDPELWPAAAQQLLAYLIALEREGRVRARDLAGEPVYSLTLGNSQNNFPKL
jgi:glyoxylase-like metal-dependent hydrolase (beta-lactamase superfamily II)